jgi:hypothetical protein
MRKSESREAATKVRDKPLACPDTLYTWIAVKVLTILPYSRWTANCGKQPDNIRSSAHDLTVFKRNS